MTRDERVDDGFSRALVALGAQATSLQTIAHRARRGSGAARRRARGRSTRFDWIVFTSAHGVDATCARPAWRSPLDRGARPLVAAVGAATAAQLGARGVPVAVKPTRASALDLVAALVSVRARPGWGAGAVAALRHRAARPAPTRWPPRAPAWSHPIAYRTVAVTPAGPGRASAASLEAGRVDAVAFLSPSSARGARAGDARQHARAGWPGGRSWRASVRPRPRRSRALGAPPDVEPAERSARRPGRRDLRRRSRRRRGARS